MVEQKLLTIVPITPPPKEQIVARRAFHYPPQLPPDRYALPQSIQSASPIGYRTRISLTEEEATLAILKQKEKDLDSILFLGAQYLKKHKRGPMDMFLGR